MIVITAFLQQFVHFHGSTMVIGSTMEGRWPIILVVTWDTKLVLKDRLLSSVQIVLFFFLWPSHFLMQRRECE